MSITNVQTHLQEGVDLTALTQGHFRDIFVLRIPFRIRVGKLKKFRYDEEIDIWIRNAGFPRGTTSLQAMQQIHKSKVLTHPYNPAFSEAIVVNHKLKVGDDVLRAIVAHFTAQKEGPIRVEVQHFKALSAFNDWIVAFHHATNELFGMTAIHTLSSMEFFDALRFEITLVCDPSSELNDEDILNFCESKIEKELIAGEQFHGEWDDLPDDRLERLNEVLRLHKRFIFYEFALEAKTKMIEEDERAALLYSVIALEAAHAAYLKLCLADKFQHIDDERERFSKVQKLGNDLLREQGLMTVFQLTPIIFMESADRPTPEEIESCRGAISLRK